tara:strand:+ start:1281 stop:1511 length:231 start_codon:yes stop_codon:yes gene_type:complete
MNELAQMMEWVAGGCVLLTLDEHLEMEAYEEEMKAIQYAEGAWLRAAEAGDEESRRDLAIHDSMFGDRYSDGPVAF